MLESPEKSGFFKKEAKHSYFHAKYLAVGLFKDTLLVPYISLSAKPAVFVEVVSEARAQIF